MQEGENDPSLPATQNEAVFPERKLWFPQNYRSISPFFRRRISPAREEKYDWDAQHAHDRLES